MHLALPRFASDLAMQKLRIDYSKNIPMRIQWNRRFTGKTDVIDGTDSKQTVEILYG